jgi:hypothetical protein
MQVTLPSYSIRLNHTCRLRRARNYIDSGIGPATCPRTELRGSDGPVAPFSESPTTHPQRALRHKSLVPPCFVNQLLDRFAWSVNE